MTVIVQLREQAQPIDYDNVKNTYQKGDLYCIYKEDGTVDKFPIVHIWRIRESYN
jgi:hypothetical protein